MRNAVRATAGMAFNDAPNSPQPYSRQTVLVIPASNVLSAKMRSMEMNLIAAWAGVFAGLIVAVPIGLKFNEDEWLGGYNSWTRRLLRLGHIACFGLAFLNFAYVATAKWLNIPPESLALTSLLFVVAQATMPLTCFAAAFQKPLRHLFVVPVVTLVAATGSFLFLGLLK